jgi:DNA-binding IclR family transcriptional regulator
MKHNSPKISSIEKALDILTACICGKHEMSTGELSEILGYNITTVHRILHILSKKGYLRQDERSKQFKFGPVAFEMGRAVFQSISGKLLNIAVPYLVDLSEQAGETVVLEALSDRTSIIIYISQGRHGITIRPGIGDKAPFHASVGAKAMLAFLDPQLWDRYLDGELVRLTPKTVIDVTKLKRQLNKVRRQGVALGREEMALGINAIGAPVFDHDNDPVGAVVIIGLAQNVACDIQSPMVQKLKKTAKEISARLFNYDFTLESKERNIEKRKISKAPWNGHLRCAGVWEGDCS